MTTYRSINIGNNYCDFRCNNEECNFDGGDCIDYEAYVGCPPPGSFCTANKIANRACDVGCNNEECLWDDGACESSTFSLSSGSCTIVDTHCLQSPNYPSHYGNNQGCQATVLRDDVISSVAFNTESGYDELRIGSRYFDGSEGPDNFQASIRLFIRPRRAGAGCVLRRTSRVKNSSMRFRIW